MTPVEQFLFSLEIMGEGMLGIFVVTLIIVGIISLITKIGGKRNNGDGDN